MSLPFGAGMSTVKDLSCSGGTDLANFLDQFDDVLCDCDGVLYITYKPIEGALETVQKLRELGKRVRFISNNSLHSAQGYSDMFGKMKLMVAEEDVVTPVVAILNYLKGIGFEKKLLVLGSKKLREQFVEGGFDILGNGPDFVEETVDAFKSQFTSLDPDVGAIIVDWDVNLNYVRLQKAIMYASKQGMLYLTAGTDKHVPIAPGFKVMGPGKFQKIVEEESGNKPLTFGKPGKPLSDYIDRRYNLNPERTLFIGDTYSDMEFASEAGYKKLIVYSGILKEKDVANFNEKKYLPNYSLNKLGDLLDLIQE